MHLSDEYSSRLPLNLAIRHEGLQVLNEFPHRGKLIAFLSPAQLKKACLKAGTQAKPQGRSCAANHSLR
jgi:hypothetical protein